MGYPAVVARQLDHLLAVLHPVSMASVMDCFLHHYLVR